MQEKQQCTFQDCIDCQYFIRKRRNRYFCCKTGKALKHQDTRKIPCPVAAIPLKRKEDE